jgi:hypothetical protein
MQVFFIKRWFFLARIARLRGLWELCGEKNVPFGTHLKSMPPFGHKRVHRIDAKGEKSEQPKGFSPAAE